MMKGQIDGEMAQRLFNGFAARAAILEEPECFEQVAIVLTQLLRYDIDDSVFTDAVLSAQLKAFRGRHPARIISLSPSLFEFLNQLIQKSHSTAVCAGMGSWFQIAIPETAPAIAHLLTTGLSVDCVDERSAGAIADKLTAILADFPINFDALTPLFALLEELFVKCPRVLDPIGAVLDLLVRFAATGEEKAAEIEVVPLLAEFVLQVYVRDPEVEVNPELLLPVVKQFPFLPEVKELPNLFELLISLLEYPDRFECVLLPALEMLTGLLMDRKRLNEYPLPEATVAKMKAILRLLVRQNRSLEATLSQPYRASRTKLSRFKMLLR
jgi:hypothetical protein